jgi:hypothetical protein
VFSYYYIHGIESPFCFNRTGKNAKKVKTGGLEQAQAPSFFEYRYGWYNGGVEPRGEEPALPANYMTMEIWNWEKGNVTYRNGWETDMAIGEKNVGEMAACACARRKIKNEHNNALKPHRYHLERGFGHGREHACGIYAILNPLAFQTRGVMPFLDEGYKKARGSICLRDEFFFGPRFIFGRYLFQPREEFIGFIMPEDKPDR